LPGDKELIQRVARQDGEALNLLMQRHTPILREQLLRMLRDESAVDDVLQEVTIRLWEKAQQWRGEGSLHAWLMRMATNLALNHIRSIRRRRQVSLERPSARCDEDTESLIPAWMIDQSAGPDEIVSLDEQRAILQDLLAALPEEKREVLRLAHEQEMDLAAIARVLEIPLGTVKSRLYYASRWLGRRWQDIQGEHE
jgi:RNA polymerase sigma-70 factor (ECF subfamily)